MAGVAALALVVLCLGYLLPHRARQRQHWGQARAEDRFSGSLRVLAVAGPQAVPGDRKLDARRSPHEEGTHAVETTRTDAVAPSRQDVPAPSTRLQLLERRAAAARRRLMLTVMLLLATVAVAVCAVFALVPWWSVMAPGVLLLLVLVLGRQAARAARRADAEWLAQHRAAAGRSAVRPVRPGAPLAHRQAGSRVTGRAVHTSQAHTQMIPRVTAQDIDRARASREAHTQNGTATDDADTEDHRGPDTDVHGSQTDQPDSQVTSRAAEVSGSVHHPAPWEIRPPSGRVWDPIPVPPPTYTMKSAAGQGDALPLVPTPPVADEVIGVPPITEPAAGPTPVAGPVPTRPVGDEPKPKTETLGLDLNEILARRRAAGQ